MKPLGDIQQLREDIFERARQSVLAVPEVSQADYKISISDVDYIDPPDFTPDDIADAIMNRRTLGRRLRGTVRFISPSGEIAKKTVLATVPTVTDWGTFIIDGVEYSVLNQQRLRNGIYVRRKQSGEPEAYVNLAAGRTHRYVYNPDTGIFTIAIGQRNIPLYPVLKALGVEDKVLKDVWGPDVLTKNQATDDPKAVETFAKQLGAPSAEALRTHLVGMSLDPNVVQRNLGIKTDALTPDVLVAATGKMLKMYSGAAEEDDRDALVNQAVWTPADLLAESLSRSNYILRGLLWKLMRKPDRSAISSYLLDPRVSFIFREAKLADIPAGTNPLDRLDHIYRLTRMGEGGIGSIDAIPDSSRMVHPTHFGFIDPSTTPESLKVGVDTRLTVNTMVGPDGQVKSLFTDVRTGKKQWLSPVEIYDKVVSFPGEIDTPNRYIRAISRGREVLVPRERVDYVLADATDMYGPLANLIPLKSATFPQRIAMGSRMLTQAVPLLNREAPFVRSAAGNGRPFVEIYGQVCGSLRAPTSGVVDSVTDKGIVIKGDDGKTYNIPIVKDLPQSDMTGLTMQPVVAAGQRVKPGQPLTVSNYTDKDGNVAIGVNARIAYMPTGETYEDAFVISESFAKRLTSEHLIRHDLDTDQSTLIGKKQYVSVFPGKYTRQQLDAYDEAGVIKPGTVVTKDTPLILAVTALPMSTATGRRRMLVDSSVTWDHDHPGTVVGVIKRDGGYTVLVRSFWPAESGDKICGLYGNKGVVIVRPDNQMPRDSEGRVIDVLANPLGLISRGNVGQIYEALLGKVAEKTGKPIIIKDFNDAGRLHEIVKDQLKLAGLSDTEELYDPETGKTVRVLTGKSYILKLRHMADEKLQGVGLATAHSTEDIPVAGEEGKTRRIGQMELNALLAHGAFANITDASLIRGQKDEQLWRMYMSGHALPKPRVPQIWNKFIYMLTAAGINPVYTPRSVKVFALSNKDVDTLIEGRYIDNDETVRLKDDRFLPVGGGLFDERLTGGLAGTRWAGIKLPEPMPNPVMLEPISRILETTPSQLEQVIIGKKQLPSKWGINATGPAAVAAALSKLDIDKEIKMCEYELKDASPSRASQLYQKLSYLQAAKAHKQHPKDWLWTAVPVLPPLFRPISALQDGTLIVNDANYLYKELINAASLLQKARAELDDPTVEREAVWRSLKAVVGLDEPQSYTLRRTGVRGILATIAGTSPKAGIMQRKMLGVAAMTAGRGVIIPNPQLDIDQIGLPEDVAMGVYKPFVVRELVRRGASLQDAFRKAKDMDADAMDAMRKVMNERPVLVNRAPTLHKYGIMAFKPVLTKRKAIEICPLVTAAFGADFDGDTMQFHVPVSDAAVQEAKERMMPSRNLFSAAQFTTPMYTPSQEYLLGLWLMSKPADLRKPTKVFRTKEDAVAAFRRGEISIDQPVTIVEK